MAHVLISIRSAGRSQYVYILDSMPCGVAVALVTDPIARFLSDARVSSVLPIHTAVKGLENEVALWGSSIS